MHIAPPVTTTPPAAVATPPPTAPPTAASAHHAYASRHGGQHGNCQPDLDPVNQRFRLAHAGQPFAEK
jgi:hypothetical protein